MKHQSVTFHLKLARPTPGPCVEIHDGRQVQVGQIAATAAKQMVVLVQACLVEILTAAEVERAQLPEFDQDVEISAIARIRESPLAGANDGTGDLWAWI
jgi:hypothetical protein